MVEVCTRYSCRGLREMKARLRLRLFKRNGNIIGTVTQLLKKPTLDDQNLAI